MSAEFPYKGPKRSFGSFLTPRSTRGFEGPEGPISGGASRHQGELSVMERDLKTWREGLPAPKTTPIETAPPTMPDRRAMLRERLRQASDLDLPEGQRMRQLEDHLGDIPHQGAGHLSSSMYTSENP